MRAVGGLGDEARRLLAAGAARVLLLDRLEQRGHRRLAHERDRAAAEAAARHPRAEDAGDAHRDLDQGVELRARDLVLVAERGVRPQHERAHLGVVARLERVDRLQRARVLGDAVARALQHVQRERRLRVRGVEHRGGGVAEELHLRVARRAHRRARLLALAHAVGVLASRERVLDVRVGDDEGDVGVGERHELRGEGRAAVDEEDVAGDAARRDELVHDAALAPDPPLGLLPDQREVLGADPEAAQVVHGRGHRHLERRGGAQAR